MLCEKCGIETEATPCGNCGAMVLKLGPYCYSCGATLECPVNEESVPTVDFSSRILCSDGSCIGVVNEQGVCKVCGKPYATQSE